MSGGVKISCPNCGRILGDTDSSIDATLNCNGCKKRVHIGMSIVSFKDYLATIKQEQKNDKSE